MKKEDHIVLMILGIIIQIILVIPVFLFIWRFVIRKIIHPNPIQKYRKENSYAIITGASDGIGKAYAKRMAKEKFNLILIARRENLLKELKEELEKEYKVKIEIIAMDLNSMNAEQWNILNKLFEDYNISVLINNVGFLSENLYHQIPMDSVNRMIRLNVEIPILLTHSFINSVKKENTKEKKLIIFMSSCSSQGTAPYSSIYASTKSFISQFCKSIAYEYPYIDCTSFRPWHISTDMIGNIPLNIGVCTPDQFVESCFVHVGLTNEIDPYIPHYLQDWSYYNFSYNYQARATIKEFKYFQNMKEKKQN